jgi:hypothetical protein
MLVLESKNVDGSEVGSCRPSLTDELIDVLNAMANGADNIPDLQKVTVLETTMLVGLLTRLKNSGLVFDFFTIYGDGRVWLLTTKGREITELFGLGDAE